MAEIFLGVLMFTAIVLALVTVSILVGVEALEPTISRFGRRPPDGS